MTTSTPANTQEPTPIFESLVEEFRGQMREVPGRGPQQDRAGRDERVPDT